VYNFQGAGAGRGLDHVQQRFPPFAHTLAAEDGAEMRTSLTDAMMQAARDRLPSLHAKLERLKAKRERLPAVERAAIDSEIKIVASELASAYARSQGQVDCEPPEVAEWVTPTPAEPGEAKVVRWPPDAA
jgi:hypothetical protein